MCLQICKKKAQMNERKNQFLKYFNNPNQTSGLIPNTDKAKYPNKRLVYQRTILLLTRKT